MIIVEHKTGEEFLIASPLDYKRDRILLRSRNYIRPCWELRCLRLALSRRQKLADYCLFPCPDLLKIIEHIFQMRITETLFP